MNLSEDFLHFVWQFRLYAAENLQTCCEQSLRVLQSGLPNKNAGPDFMNAKLIVGETTWAGNIEIHIRSSDWYEHKHHLDKAYDNVILHVVYFDDQPVKRTDGTLIPTLELHQLIEPDLLLRYAALLENMNDFPCQPQIGDIDPFVIEGFLSRTLVERLIARSGEVFHKLESLKGNWDETFYQFLAKSFGFKINALPMEMLAQSLPQQLFAKHKNQPFQIEALLFGQAGFLAQPFKEEYPSALKKEYAYLKQKYQLNPIEPSVWKFMRMRPQNFPTLRLAQFAALVVKSNHLFAKVLAAKDHGELIGLFEDLPVNPFWNTHYHFNKATPKAELQLGRESIHNLLINTVSVFLFAYGKAMQLQNYQTRALKLLENISAEKNAVVKLYANAKVNVKNAYHSQAILQLKKNYCNEKKCLNCGIGIKILKH
ncbi:DUF2851 family protein [Pedobacter sp.]|uniref:DUF2851 family protein n=1 Tax=Pedobacter sp. TaxID=1411316 RepID=UPI00396C31D3